MKVLKSVTILLLLAGLFAQSKVGTSAASFLGIPLGTRAIAMGGAFTSLADASSNYWNPGAISRIGKSDVSFSKIEWLDESSFNYFSAVFNLGRNNAAGFYWSYLDYGDEEVTTWDDQTGTGDYWSARDMVIGLTYGQNLSERFSIGGAFKYVHQSIYNETAGSSALDLGLLYLSASNRVRVGMSISNFGFDMKMTGPDLYETIDLAPNEEGNNETLVAALKTDDFPLPIFFRVGMSADVWQTSTMNLMLTSDMLIPSDDVEQVNLGAELDINRMLFVRAGYQALGKSDAENGFSFGVGAEIWAYGSIVKIDYSIQDFGVWGSLPVLGLSFGF